MQEMPKLKPLRVPFDPPHHTADVDWDWSHTDWSLTDEVYVSEPKCLKWWSAHIPRRVTLCKHAGTTALNEGRMVTQFRVTNDDCGVGFAFRNQAAVGTANEAYMYWLLLMPDGTNVYLVKFLNSVQTIIDVKKFGGGFTLPNNTWRKIRVTWWETGGVIYVRVEWYNGGEWTKICDDFFDADNLWSGEAVNRCGLAFMRHAATNYIMYTDDTEVWGP